MNAAALPPSALEELAFLAGHWRGEHDNVVIEEMWLAPKGGVAQATVRLVQAGKVGTIELIVVAAERDRVVMRYNHFEPDYRTWEDDGPIELTLTEAARRRLVFTNLAATPKHALEMGYESVSNEELTSWVISIRADGARTRHTFDFARAAQGT